MSTLDQASYSIGEVVAALRPDFEVTESNLRFWEKQGLLEPQRTPGGHRVYTAADVERIKLIKHLQAERHLPLSSIRQVCSLAAENPDDAAFFINNVLRPQFYEPGYQPRNAKELAAETGLSLAVVEQLTKAGLLRPQPVDDDPVPRYDEDDRAICRMVAQWQGFGFGLEPFVVRAELIQTYLRSEWERIIRPNFERFVAIPHPQRMRLKQMAEELENLLFSTARRRIREELWQSGELAKLTCQSEEA